jgi:histidinol-phosphate aminotransferase
VPARIRSAIEALPEYPERDLRDADIAVRLHRNESALVAPDHVVAALRAIDGEMLRRYPTELQRSLEGRLAGRLDAPVTSLALANGADEILGALAHVFLDAGDDALSLSPTFGMYARVAAIAGAQMRTVPYRRLWRIDLDDIVTAAGPRTKLLFLGHPNNPTGDVLRAADIELLARALPGVAIAIDEVYLSLSRLSLVRIAGRFENVIAIGSLSKSAALAGARVGYAIASARIAAALRRTLPPYPLAVASLVAAGAYLSNESATAAFETQLRAQTERSLDALEAGIGPFAQRVARGPANFVLMEFGGRGTEIFEALDAAGIRARIFEAPQLQGAIRFCAASDGETERTIACVRRTMQRRAAYA